MATTAFPSRAGVAHQPRASILPVLGLTLYFSTSFFYIFESGSPQPADYMLLTMLGATLICAWRRLPDEPLLYMAVALYVGWVIMVNMVWFFIDGEFTLIKKTSFYIYNMIVFLFVVAIGFHDFARLKKWILRACLVALLAQIFYIEVLGGGGVTSRSTGTFNNPNQLGYWALLLLACFGVLKERSPLGLVDILTLGAGFYVISLSLSKAASISGMLLICMILFFCRTRRNAGLLMVGLVMIGLSVQIARGGLVERFMEIRPIAALQDRLAGIGKQRDDNLLERGYSRLFEYPQYLAFGTGEGSFSRITGEVSDTKEFHSTLGNLLMSYGLVGIALFMLLLLTIFGGAPWPSVFYLVPVMMYGITHMGLRFSLFWVFVGLVYAQARYGASPRPALYRFRQSGRARPHLPAVRAVMTNRRV